MKTLKPIESKIVLIAGIIIWFLLLLAIPFVIKKENQTKNVSVTESQK